MPFRRTAALLLSILPLTTLAQDLKPADNLVVEGVPTIPASLVEDVSRYTQFRAAAAASWHPTKREMLIRTRFADTYQVHHLAMPLGARKQVTFFPDTVSGAAYCPAGPDAGQYFVFAKDKGGNEFAQLYRFDLATGAVTLLTDGKSRNGSLVWAEKGGRIAYTSTRRNGKDPDVYLMNPKDPSTDKLLAQVDKPGFEIADWSPDESKLLLEEYVSINETYLWLMDAATGEKTALTPRVENAPEPIAYRNPQFSRDGKGVYYTTDKSAEFQRLVYLDFASKQETPLTAHINWDVETFALSYDGKRLAFITNEDGLNILHLLDTATGKEVPAPKFPAGQVSNLQWHRNNRDLAVNVVSARATADVYSADVTSGEVTRWTESETGGLPTDSFSEPKLVRWTSFDGKQISGFLYPPSPKFTGKRPVIINIHGGPEAQFRPAFLGQYNYYLNELGVAVIFPNVRGSAGYGKEFLKLDNGFKREDAVKDIGALLDWVKSQPDLDADRVMITGGSYGGYMSLACATHFADRIRCSVDVVGISNFVTFLEHTESYRRDLRRVEYGDERDPKMREFLTQISPLTSAAKITKPLFVVQGANDPRVPASEAQQIVETVKRGNTPVWFLLAKDEGHGFAKKKNADYQFYATVLFVREYLLK